MHRRGRILVGLFTCALLGAIGGPAAIRAADLPMSASFSPAAIPVGGSSELRLAFSYASESHPAAAVTFDDTLPIGLTVSSASYAPAQNGCGALGTITTTAPNRIQYSATIPADSSWSCELLVTVTGVTAGDYAYAPAPFSIGSDTFTAPAAPLTVLTPPTVAMAFGQPAIGQGESTSLTFTVHNPNAVDLTGVAVSGAFADAGLVVATPNGVSGSCGGTVSAPAGGGSIGLTAGTLAAGATCTFSADVVGAAQGTRGANATITSTETGAGTPASASLVVGIAPTLSATFEPGSIPVGGTSTLRFGLYNPETSSDDLTNVAFTATLPAGLSAANGSSSVCPSGLDSGTLTVTGGNTVAVTGVPLPAGWSCSLSVTVTGSAAGIHAVTTSQVTSSESIPGAAATARLLVGIVGPVAVLEFEPDAVTVNSISNLEFTISNPNTTATLTGVGFNLTLPAGLTASAATASLCDGTLTVTPGAISMGGASLAAGAQCAFAVTVRATTIDTKTVTVAVDSVEGGTGPSASARLLVVNGPPPSSASVSDGRSTSGGWTLMLVAMLAGSAYAVGRLAIVRRRR